MERFLSRAAPRRERAAAAAEAALARGAELARFLGEDPNSKSADPNALLLTVWQFATAYDAALGALRRREALARAKQQQQQQAGGGGGGR